VVFLDHQMTFITLNCGSSCVRIVLLELGTSVLCKQIVIPWVYGSCVEVPFVNLVKILHSDEGGDVEQWLEPRNKSSCVCD